MQELRRQQLLGVLGVDRYRLRSATPAESPAVVVEVAAEVVAEPAPPKVAEAKPVEKAAPKPAKAKVEKPAGATSLTLLWWQFEDLLFVEAAAPGATSSNPALLQLAQNIAAALGRSQNLNGELHWPPGGDFNAISQADFLHHFVRGRAEAAEVELQLILTSEALQIDTAELATIHVITPLTAMLADPLLKSATWQILKPLRRS